jgi:hypothetical protein
MTANATLETITLTGDDDRREQHGNDQDRSASRRAAAIEAAYILEALRK